MYLEAQRRLPGGVPLFPKLKTYCGGGAPVPPQLHYALRAQAGGSGISGSYGLTECPMITFASPSDSDEVRANTAGKARQGGEIKIVDADGNRVPTGTPGEILVRGPMLTMGYADESLNAAAFDAEGWFRTGDLGSLDAVGNVNISGRVKDVIIRNMENVSPAEVEQLLTDHPAISDLAVIGLPDERTGERVVAVVMLVQGATLTLPDLAKWCREQGIMPQKIPEQLEIVEDLPRIGYGKTDKIKLRQRFVG